MTVRGFVTANGLRTVEHCQFGGFPPVADGGLGQALLEGVLPALEAHYTAIGTTGAEAPHVGDLFDVRLNELRAVREATLPVALER
jgi:hypothetical protein